MSTQDLKLFPQQILRYQTRIAEQLGARDNDRLNLFLGILSPDTGNANLATAYQTLFPDLDAEAAASAFRKFRLNFNNAAKEAGHPEVQLSGDSKKKSPNEKRACWIIGPDTLVAEIEELSRAGAANTEDHEPLPSRVIAKDNRIAVQFFVSFSHNNDQDKDKLLALLKEELGASEKYRFTVWTDGQIILGEKWHDEIQTALQACDLGLLLVSPTFLSSAYIKDHELPDFVNGKKPCIPVELKTIDFKNHKLLGLEERQLFRLKQGTVHKAFSMLRTKQDREAFARDLAKGIYARLEAHPPSPRPSRSNHAMRPTKPQLHQIAEEAALDLDCQAGFIPTRARAWGIQYREAANTKPSSSDEDHDAIQFLRDWALNPKEPPFFALLGEYGMGKTTTLKQFTRRLLEEREHNPALPLPIYIDLRHRMNPKNGVPRLEEILDNALQRNWRKTETLTVNAQQLIQLARQGKAIVLFDGLDEQIVHFSEADAQTFIRELWSITPPAVIGGPNPPSTKVLISCRSHYFKDLKQQDNMLTGEQREGLKPSHYRVAFILPFTVEQIRGYLNQELGEEPGRQAWDLLTEIHDLKDLASRPYLLSLITSHIEELEHLKASGQPIRPITLYQIMTRKWLDRDAGKHHIDPEHKPRFMGALAAAMHKDRAREWPWSKLMKWFDSFLLAQPDLALAYQNKERSLLLEDLRTATFILRRDTEDQNFRFAHSSLLEYFLSFHLNEALAEGKLVEWDMPQPSQETHRFLGEWLAVSEDDSLQIASMEALLEQAQYPQATLNAFHYFLLAAREDLPLPQPSGFSLAGQDLSDLKIWGRKESSPLTLANADFTGGNLRRTQWENVNLTNALFTKSELQQSNFSECVMTDADFSNADLTSAHFVDCAGNGARFEGCASRSVHFHRCRGIQPNSIGQTVIRGGDECLTVVPRAGDSVVKFSPDGRSILSAGGNRSLKLWDATTAKCLLTFEGHTNWITSAAFSPDGSLIVSGGTKGKLLLWDAMSAKCLLAFNGHEGVVTSTAFSPDGRSVVSASGDGTVRLWDTTTAKCILIFEGHATRVSSAAFSPDGRFIVSAGGDGTLRLWDAASAKFIQNFEGHKNRVTFASFSPDGRTIVSAGIDGTLRLWDAATAKCMIVSNKRNKVVNSAVFSPDGRSIVSASRDGTLRLWDAASGRLRLTFEGHTGFVTSAAFSPDGRSIVSAGNDGTLRLWDADSAKCLLALESHNNRITSFAYAPDGGSVVSSLAAGGLQLLEATSARPLLTFEGHKNHVNSAVFSPDGQTIITTGADGAMLLWNAATAKCQGIFDTDEQGMSYAAFSPDGRSIVSVGWGGTLNLWDVASAKRLLTFDENEYWSNIVAFSPDGKSIISADDDGTLRLLDVASGKCLLVFKGHDNWITSATFSPDGRTIISTGGDGAIRLWDVASAECLVIFGVEETPVSSAAFSPDGRTVISAGGDGTLRLWDFASAECLATFEGHKDWVTSAVFSPDGRSVLSAGADGTLRFWDLVSGQEIHSITGHQPDENACVIFRENRILWAEKDAWRHLQWTLPPKEGEIYPTPVPGDYFEDFPICLNE